MPVRRSGTLHGIAGWFTAGLTADVRMSNSPLDASAIDRDSAFFPLEAAVGVREGDVVELSMHIIPPERVVTWRTSVTRPELAMRGRSSLASFVHSTFNGMFLSREGLMKTRPAFKPKLTRRGQARAVALTLCNGERPLAEIEDSLFAQYPTCSGAAIRQACSSAISSRVTPSRVSPKSRALGFAPLHMPVRAYQYGRHTISSGISLRELPEASTRRVDPIRA